MNDNKIFNILHVHIHIEQVLLDKKHFHNRYQIPGIYNKISKSYPIFCVHDLAIFPCFVFVNLFYGF